MTHEDHYRMAMEMSRTGASHGMIVQKLLGEKLDPDWANQIADEAITSAANRTRRKGFFTMCFGLGVVTLAWFSLGKNIPRLPISLFMTGMLITGIGFAQVIHRARLPDAAGNKKERIR